MKKGKLKFVSPADLPKNEMNQRLVDEYNRVLKEHGNFRKIVWNHELKEFEITL